VKPKQQSRPIGRAALTNVFAPQALRFGRRNVDVGDQWARVLAITNFPPKVGPAWLAKAANLPGVVLAMHGDPTDPTALTMSLNRQISLLAGKQQISTMIPEILRLHPEEKDRPFVNLMLASAYLDVAEYGKARELAVELQKKLSGLGLGDRAAGRGGEPAGRCQGRVCAGEGAPGEESG